MFFRLIYKKKLEKLKSQKEELYHEIRKLKSEKIELKEIILFEQKRFKRIVFLLNNRVHKNTKCLIQTTNKGINVLTAINKNECEIEVFDIDNIEYNSNRKLVLWAQNRGDEYFIKDIQGGDGKGHGEIAMNHLIELAKKESMEKIIGEISSVDFGHIDRLRAFYKKMGFEVDIRPSRNGTIIRKL